MIGFRSRVRAPSSLERQTSDVVELRLALREFLHASLPARDPLGGARAIALREKNRGGVLVRVRELRRLTRLNASPLLPEPRGVRPLPPIGGRFVTTRLPTPACKRDQPSLSRLLLGFEFGFGSEPKFIASTVRPARPVPQLIRPQADRPFAGAHALFLLPVSSLGAGPSADRRDKAAP